MKLRDGLKDVWEFRKKPLATCLFFKTKNQGFYLQVKMIRTSVEIPNLRKDEQGEIEVVLFFKGKFKPSFPKIIEDKG